MLSDQQVSKALMDRNWTFGDFERLDKIDAGLKKTGVSPSQVLPLIEANNDLKDPDFRTAAFDLLELRKRTGRSSKGAETYINYLDSQIASKEKQCSDEAARIEKLKEELEGWKQKRNEEKARFETERARNEQVLKEDGEKLNRELSLNNEIRGNIEETVSLKTELKKVNLDLAAFKSILIETVQKAGIGPHIAENIIDAVKKFSSLSKATAEEEKEESARKQAIAKLSAEETTKGETLRTLDVKIAAKLQTLSQQDQQIGERSKLLTGCDEKIVRSKWQYEFFELLVSMLINSPSAAESTANLGVAGFRDPPLAALGVKIIELAKKGWTHSTESTSAQRRAAFVVSVMGNYLHSIHCDKCGANFIVNKAANAHEQYRTSYYCPVCDSSIFTEPDDTFLDLIVSPDLAKKFQHVRNFLDLTGGTRSMVMGHWLNLLYSLPKEVHKALSEGSQIEVKVINGTDPGKKL